MDLTQDISKTESKDAPKGGSTNGPAGAPKIASIAPKPAVAEAPPVAPVKPTAPAARMKRRHWGLILSFLLLVIAPVAVSVWYLYFVAADQYSSRVGFSVRSEDSVSPTELLGGIASFSTGESKDTDVLFEFIQSQQLVKQIDDRINLKGLFSKPENDPVFALETGGAIEDLLSYWKRMVNVHYDAGTGLIDLRVKAFAADDAQLIAKEIFSASSELINELTAISRNDATRYADTELDKAKKQLKSIRQEMTQFRGRTQIVDPSADVQGQMGLLTTLQAQLAEALIDFDLLSEVTSSTDPRIEQSQRKIDVIEKRITAERKKFGFNDINDDTEFSELLGQFEVLTVERQFAEQSYFAARAAYETALAEAGRQSRYLAAYVKPTLAETPEYPQRALIASLIFGFALLIWGIAILIVYSIKDRR